MIGRQLGHFRIIEELGAGGMGVVYKATDLRLQRTVALKLLPRELSADPERRARLLREARAVSGLNHPNILVVHEIDSAEAVDFIAMEYVEGQTLDKLIRPGGVELAEALAYAAQIAEALCAAHAHGIVHRDLKPANVMVTPAGQVKVLDFGLAKRLPEPMAASESPTLTAAARTQAGVVAGTAAYMSPEQAQGRPVDGRSDLFSFGVVLYELLTGVRPFRGESLADLLGSILRDDPAPVRSLVRSLPESAERILSKLLEKDPRYRYQSAADTVADLKRVTRDLAGAPSGRPLPRLRRVPLRATVAVGLVAGAILGVWALRRRSPATRATRFRLLSDFAGSHRAPSLSPDGKMLAYIETERGIPQVWVKNVVEGEPLQVTTGEVAAARPRWSPKGDQIVFERRRQGLWSVPPLGGTPRRVVERGRCANFFPGGERLVFDSGTELWTARGDGSGARRVEGVAENYFSWYVGRCAAVSPDGQWLAYFHPARGPNGDLWVIPASGGMPRRLTFDDAPAGEPVFSRDGRFVVFSSARAGGRTLWRVPFLGGAAEPLTTGAGEDAEPDLSVDGRALVYTNARHSYVLRVLDTKTGAERAVLERRSSLNGPVFSPGGDRIAFFARAEDGEQIFIASVEGRDKLPVTSGGVENIMPRWAPDGSSLFFFRADPPAFCRVPAAGGAVTRVIEGWRWSQQNGGWPDPGGTRISFTVVEGTKPKAALIRHLASGKQQRLAQVLWSARWSPDGRTLVAHTHEGEIFVCPADGSDCRHLASGEHPSFSADGRRVFFARSGRPLDDAALKAEEAWVVDLDGTHARRVATLEPQDVLATPFDVSVRDEIVWVQFQRGREELWLADLPAP